MNTKVLVDAVVRQTTVLIANLSTAAGVRAPLAHVADQVFLDLSRAIENQGIGRKVVADMFGLALRSYQKRVNRLAASEGEVQNLLWDAVLAYVTEHAPIARAKVLIRFHYDGEAQVAAVLNDLVESGMLTRTGRGMTCVYGVANPDELEAMVAAERSDTLAWVLWVIIYRAQGLTLDELNSMVPYTESEVAAAVGVLLEDGRARDEDGALYGETLSVPVGSAAGWEAAVFDHFQAVCTAIGQKIRGGISGSNVGDKVGGATLHFDLTDGHPYHERVTDLLRDIRAQVNELWNEVHAYNQENDISEDAKRSLVFYFGQYMVGGFVPDGGVVHESEPGSEAEA